MFADKMTDCDRCPHGVFKEIHCYLCEIMNRFECLEENLDTLTFVVNKMSDALKELMDD